MRSQTFPVSARPVLEAGVSHWTWARSVAPEMEAFCGGLLSGSWFEVRFRSEPSAIAAVLAEEMDRLVEHRAGREILIDDVSTLGELLADAAGSASVDIRLEHGPGGACPVFHQDLNILRLLCTYVGPGTEWLRESDVDRSQLGLRGRTPDEANRAIVNGRPLRAATGEVLVAKGARFGSGAEGLVHRSPPVDLGERVMVVIDPVSPADPRKRLRSVTRG